MGHVHLQVTDIGSTVDFYSNVLGFEVTAMWDSAAFMSAGGYHHHIGANVWNSRGKGTAPSGSAALRSATIEVVDMSELDRLESRLGCAGVDWVRNGESLETTDPSGIALRVEVRERRGSRDG
jgi:catechol 2,3-dioxygenase